MPRPINKIRAVRRPSTKSHISIVFSIQRAPRHLNCILTVRATSPPILRLTIRALRSVNKSPYPQLSRTVQNHLGPARFPRFRSNILRAIATQAIHSNQFSSINKKGNSIKPRPNSVIINRDRFQLSSNRKRTTVLNTNRPHKTHNTNLCCLNHRLIIVRKAHLTLS